jgi:hypothetical protein
MPVKILTSDEINSGKSTESLTGQIAPADISAMKSTFNTWVQGTLPPLPNGSPIIAKLGWFITKEQLDALFNLYATEKGEQAALLEITCAVHLNENSICDGESMENDLTIILEAKKDRTAEASTFVLIPGYDDFPGTPDDQKGAQQAACCPSSKPPGA